METDNKVKIDLRPPYVFAYYSESSEFGIADIVYYSKQDMLLHYRHKASEWSFVNENNKDEESVFAIADNDVNALQEVFGLMIDAYISYLKRGGEEWFVCDGSFCTVICGRKRVHFEGPSIEPFCSFENMIYQTLIIDDERERPDYEELRKQLPIVKERLKNLLTE
jgi:hypothetical protein